MSTQTTTRRKVANALFGLLAFLAIFASLVTLVALLFDVVVRGGSSVDLQFFTSAPSRIPAKAGILPALVGTLWVTTLVAIMTFPIGVAAAIYLEEYAGRGRWSRLLRINISNLAGVPSIVYGIFGLALFVRLLGLGRTVFAAALTLSLLILPVVIISSMEAIRAVPPSQREAAYALGATRWQMVRRALLPAAAPGILTGIVLAVGRAVGETAPLILIGAVTFVTFVPVNPFEDKYTVLPIQIFNWAGRPQAAFQEISAAAILVLLVLMFLLNLVAVILRARLSRTIQW
ncbi:MAG: phosphate ABC transporter permease PstA [Candidatus Aquidulcis sp.]|jgi:phosphate transport system permease protein|nr:MAG: phosphate ABC transporter permease PstA [Candidatus Aquidulcis sp.]